PVAVEHTPRPQGHGYVSATVHRMNPFFPIGTRLRGHEFHYSRVTGPLQGETALAIDRGVGLGNGCDGLMSGRVVATWTHLHALGTEAWAPALVQAALHGAWRRTA
ncbi:MAG TPA: hypothetical protein VI356_13200, partial [Myxococcales bacterium]